MTVLFTSDLHLGHRKVAEIRGFESAVEHDTAICDNWLDVVRPEDHVWVLGDLAASSPAHALSLLYRLPGVKHLIWGNHDRGHPMHRDASRKASEYSFAFASMAQSARRRIEGTEVLLSHFPYYRDRPPVMRYPQWRLPNYGAWLMHGHTHGRERVTIGPRRWEEGRPTHEPITREIHVGVDAWGLAPVSLDTIAGLMREHA